MVLDYGEADEMMLRDMSWPEDGLSAPTDGGDLLILDTYAPMIVEGGVFGGRS